MVPHPREIHIESLRLSIRPFSAADADPAFQCITPSLTRFMAWDPPANREEFDRVWQAWLQSIDEGTEVVFAIRHRDDGGFLGLVGLHCLRDVSPELGVWIREDRHKEAFGREAVTLVAQWASRTLRTASFVYPVAEDNYPSRRIAESIGGVVVESRETPKYKSVVYAIPGQLKFDSA
ncbi:GNAT family N-acetyltransferase [Paraburkholderia acidicola]|uniref:GNAT family N-acetyltransferase n=1 Tax=Paraburkholderia acidicola TaxID=1912599 RepID=A0ABV1LRZ1_9BURK